MLRIFFAIQCDVCGDFFDNLQTSTTAAQNLCAVLAGNMIGAAEQDGWFFNSKTRQVWCADCILALAGNEKMPPVSEIFVPDRTANDDEWLESDF